MFFKKYVYGDAALYYVERPVEGCAKATAVGLCVLPKDAPFDPKKVWCDSLVQVAFTGDVTLVDHTRGVTMRNHDSTVLKVLRQAEFVGGALDTRLGDGAGNEYVHSLSFDRATGVFTVSVRYENHTGAPRTLEHLSSFSLSGIAGASGNTMGLRLHRMTSAWSRECRLRTDTFSRLGMDMSWARFGVKNERWGQVGSTPNRGWFPFAAIEDPAGGYTLGAMLEAPGSWQFELYEEKESCSLSGGLADYEFGHWRKTIPAGGSFTTHAARFVLKKGGVNEVCNALVHEQDSRLRTPESEEDMPVIYNEYCASWGNPTQKRIERQLGAAAKLGAKYFVIDAGWYKPLDCGWSNAMGDWEPNPEYFPDLRELTRKIEAKGMRAGIWFEFEVAGGDSKLYRREEMFVRRDGAILNSKNRRFLDLRKPEVKSYLDERLVRFLRGYGFGYLKIDYNDSIGVGCDDESLGEGGRRIAEESVGWLDRLKQNVPGLVIENCSSGGSRIEPYRMGKVSMCSFSDAHECPEIPLVAANVSRVVPARQSQIWVVLRKKESDSRTIYSLCAAMMGRICFSGEIEKSKLELLGRGLAFYENVKEIVRRGDIVDIDCNVEYFRDPVGRQIYLKQFGDRRLAIVHFLRGEGVARIPLEGYAVKDSFTDLDFSVRNGTLRIVGREFSAGAFLLEKISR